MASETELFTRRLIVSKGAGKFGAHVRCFRKVVLAGLGGGLALVAPAALRAQASPLAPRAPLAVAAPGAAPTTAIVNLLTAAERAHDFGQFSVAEGSYRRLLGEPGVDATKVKLALTAVLLDAGRAAEADQVLATIPAPRGAAWQLRAGLAALQLRKRDAAQAAWDATKADELSEADRAWHVFLEGALYDLLPNRDRAAEQKANELYTRAEQSATTELGRARFQLAAERVRLQIAPPSDQALEQLKRLAETRQGFDDGYEQARTYAVGLAQRDRRAEAVAFLREQVQRTQNRAVRDEFDFLIGLIGERGRAGEGRAALLQLLASGATPLRQRQALELLATASGAGTERTQFRAELDRLIAANPPHPIREDLLYFRAQLTFAEKEFTTAESDAELLLRDYPASRLRVHAFGVLTQSAWEQQRYRRAADSARKAREALLAESTPGSRAARVRAELGVFEAEALFRAGLQAERVDRGAGAGKVDFRGAADAYAALLRERPPELEARRLGGLMFQHVLAEIKAGSPDTAARVLDERENDPAFDLESRWDAEWSLARAAQAQGDTAAAYARVKKLLAETAPRAGGLPPALRARMAWLEADLSFSAGQPAQTLILTEQLLGTLAGLDEALRGEVASTAILLKAQAELALGREPAALETLKKLRADHAKSDAAVRSYIIQAMHYAEQGKIDVAQRELTALVDNRDYSTNDYVPIALLRLAYLSDQLGGEENLTAANARIEQFIEHPAAANNVGLIFEARQKQGDILRRLNRFPQAQRAYEELVNKYPQRPEVVYAQLALAQCLNAQSSADPANAEKARAKFEEIHDRVDAPPGVRIEAGYNLGALLVRGGKPDEAALVWWNYVVTPFVVEAGATVDTDAKQAFWLGKTLLEYAELQEKRAREAEAKKALLLIVRKKLPGEIAAKKRLEQLGVPASSW